MSIDRITRFSAPPPFHRARNAATLVLPARPQGQFVYRHAWRAGDLVIWDNRATMHRARPFDDTKYVRELRRVTTLDIEGVARISMA